MAGSVITNAPATVSATADENPAGGVPAAGPHPVELAGLLHELSAHLLGADDVPQALDRLAAFTAGTCPACCAAR